MSRGNGGIMITSPDSTDLPATTTRRAKREAERGTSRPAATAEQELRAFPDVRTQ